ncbi:hypothetical protein CN692_01770 [Bacillus sp. AFS002410]|uniref:InlB B-repeat-containing protein n=1 Tax=Bacillus sp. AFS002410 TaxID=2033481 RepID=UPI000BEF36D0|nr:InlB B-repeat-containing protein [Bacillus sp. AFS002410]PEJ60841.1 hypothetical protein CN692_01770 [Bacillus sp. AFS002410]
MGKKKSKHLIKVTGSTMLISSLLFSMQGPIVSKAQVRSTPTSTKSGVTLDDAELNKLLKNITPEQRAALKGSDLQEFPVISPGINLKSNALIDVIVQFKQAPAKIAVLKQAVKGKKLSLLDATKEAEANHSTFKNKVAELKKAKKLSGATIKREYRNALNGVSMRLPANQVKNLVNTGVVERIFKSEVVKLDLPNEPKDAPSGGSAAKAGDDIKQIGADKLHNEHVTGKGIKVGVIDTGVDYNHPDLKDAFKGGYDFVDNDNDPMETTIADWEKAPANNKPPSWESYITEHGTHVSGSILARQKNNVDYAVEGVAPEADLYVYRVLGPGGSGSNVNIIAAIDRAISDKMNVINLSLGMDVNDPLSPVAVAVNNAMLSGVVTVVAAGNAGPDEKTLGTPGAAELPITVGASTVSQTITTFDGNAGSDQFTGMRLLAKNFTDNLADFKNLTLPVVDSGNGSADNFTGKDLTGKIALIQRGDITLNEKIENAKKVGAKAVILYNNVDGVIPYNFGDGTNFIPTFTMTKADGERLKALGTASLTFGKMGSVVLEGDQLADFSSRGPVEGTFNIKPDVVAPGVGIFSTLPEFVNDPGDGTNYDLAYGRMDGTSMASPHVAGAAALILQAHPDYTPFDVKVALMNTAVDLKETHSVNEVGAGRVDVYDAVHADVSVRAITKTDQVSDGKLVQVDEQTGSLSFQNHNVTDEATTASETVQIKNRSQSQNKTFTTSVKFTPSNGGRILDASLNNVTMSLPTTVNVGAGQTVDIKPTINIPGAVTPGQFEGYINMTNKQEPSEHYQVPFSIRISEKGIGKFATYPLAVTTNWENPMASPYADASISFQSPQKYLDVMLKDIKTGQYVGYVDGFDAEGALTDIEYYLPLLFMGNVHYFTGNPYHPWADIKRDVPEGDYELVAITTDADGKTYDAETLMLVDNTPPKVTLDRKPGFYQVSDSEYTSEDGSEPAIWIHGKVTDPIIDKLKKYGYPEATQANNFAYFSTPNEGGFLELTPDGEFKFPIFKKWVTDQNLRGGIFSANLAALDYATCGDAVMNYKFMTTDAPITTLTYDKKQMVLGDTLTVSMNANNYNKIPGPGNFTSTFKGMTMTLGYDAKHFEYKDIQINPIFKAYLDSKGATATIGTKLNKVNLSSGSLKIGIKDFNNNASTPTTFSVAVPASGTFTYNGNTYDINNIPMYDVSFKVINDEALSPGAEYFPINSASLVWTDANGLPGLINNQFPPKATSVNDIKIETNKSNLWVMLESSAFMKAGRLIDNKVDLAAMGAKTWAESPDGKTTYTGRFFKDVSPTGVAFVYAIFDNLPASLEKYTVYLSMPKHLTVNVKVKAGKNVAGSVIGGTFYESFDPNHAGDLNGDHIIDALDLQLLVEHYYDYGNDLAKYDVNNDGKINAYDVRCIEEGYLYRDHDSIPTQKIIPNIAGMGLVEFENSLDMDPLVPLIPDIYGPEYRNVTYDTQLDTAPTTIVVNDGSILAKPIDDPTSKGFTFIGWYKDKEGTTPWNFRKDVVTGGDLTLYAKWSQKSLASNIIFDTKAGNQSSFTVTVKPGNLIPAPTGTFTKQNKVLAGWAVDTTNPTLWNFATDRAAGDTILHAVWASPISVTFDKNDSDVSDNNVVLGSSYGVKFPVAPTRTGYTFAGWATMSNATVANFTETTALTAPITVYAVWTTNNYTVTFDSNGGSAVSIITTDYNSITAPTAPTRQGYTFVGWYKDAEGKTPWNFATDKVSNDMVLYAKWNVNTYTVHFTSNGGSQIADKKANYDSVLTLPKPTRTGYTFAGWYTDAALKTAAGTTINLKGDITLYAKWNINQYTVKFNSNGGSTVAAKTVNYNTTISQPSSPTRKGYVFLGWYKDASGKVAWNFAKDHVTANTTIYAKWVAIPAKPSNAKLTKSGKDSVKVTWSKVSGATGYEIVKSTSKTGTYSHLTNVTTTNYTNKGLSKGKTYYYKIRSYTIVGSKKIYGDFTSVISIKM